MSVTTSNLFILAWLDLTLCVWPSLGQGRLDPPDNGEIELLIINLALF